MSFTQRLMSFTFTLADTKKPIVSPVTFASSGTNSITLQGLRASCKLQKAGFPQMGGAIMRIYGMTLSDMNDLSTLGQRIYLQPPNTVLIQAGDSSGLGIVFWGVIQNAYIDFSAAPDVAFQVEAWTEAGFSTIPAVPTSINGSADVVTILKGLANATNMSFENNGVANVQIPSLYLWGSPFSQINDIKQQVKNVVNVAIVGESAGGKLILTYRNESRLGDVPLISADTGMIGYPSYTPNGIMVKTLYNKNVGFLKSIIVKSQFLPAANREWIVFGLDHDLDTMFPNGRWESIIQAYDPTTGSIPVNV